MPFLHWEQVQHYKHLKEKIDEIKASQSSGHTRDKRTISARQEAHCQDMELLSKYLQADPDRPIHIRRTLDQYHYHTLSDTSRRDEDQTCIRHFNSQKGVKKGQGIITMVDQLWMWVLPRCGTSPPTIITAFPQRSFRSDRKKPTALVSNIYRTFSREEDRSCYTLADIIASECAKIYLETNNNWHRSLQFLEIYTSSIALIVSPISLSYLLFFCRV